MAMLEKSCKVQMTMTHNHYSYQTRPLQIKSADSNCGMEMTITGCHGRQEL